MAAVGKYTNDKPEGKVAFIRCETREWQPKESKKEANENDKGRDDESVRKGRHDLRNESDRRGDDRGVRSAIGKPIGPSQEGCQTAAIEKEIRKRPPEDLKRMSTKTTKEQQIKLFGTDDLVYKMEMVDGKIDRLFRAAVISTSTQNPKTTKEQSSKKET